MTPLEWSVCEIIFSKTDFADPDDVFLQRLITTLQEKLNVIWDKLPIDTVIATFLDPRVKTALSRIPKGEVTRATNLLEKVWSFLYTELTCRIMRVFSPNVELLQPSRSPSHPLCLHLLLSSMQLKGLELPMPSKLFPVSGISTD